MAEKRCKECGEDKPLEDFWRAPRNSDGRMGRCKDCKQAEQQRRREERSVDTECAHCGKVFLARVNYSSFRQKYCSQRCSAEARHVKIAKSYPPREEIEPLYTELKLSDEKVGERYGHSYQWAFNVRRHYGIPGVSPAARRKPLSRKSDRERWGIHLKREDCCRSCGSGGRLHLHHAIPRSLAPSIKFDLRNGIPLCIRCHNGWHQRTHTVYRDVFTEEEWAWLTALEFQGIEIKHWLEDRYPERIVGAEWPWEAEPVDSPA